jgi:signal transduction histidine kinase
VQEISPLPSGDFLVRENERLDPYLYIEKEANQRALNTLRELALGSLFMLFVASIGVGWSVSGRVLRPIGRITDVAREIQATDLSRRINLEGPDDELKQLADTFDGMLGRIDDAFESQRQFIHEASHELRNPLAVIRTNIDVTLADDDASPEDLRHTAEVVQKSTERMSRLVDDLLIYARKGSLSLERERVDAGQVVAEATDEFAASAEAKGIRLECQVEPELWVDGDRLALRQALANLLANALRVSETGTTVKVSAGRKPGWIWMGVEDHGPGIPEGDQDRVFQRFWRADGERQEVGHSGLGLTIVRQIAEAHGGEVRLVSSPGEGAAFAIWLPA